ncbi:MAG: HAMP domain-containing histidine kinase [Lachnospiraceae bacterium]|nr:HAMP domain-containing histidine kinase [Lachnospiraceae bacterium]
MENNSENKKTASAKVTSIAWKINLQSVWTRARAYFLFDLLLCIVFVSVFIYGLDVQLAGAFSLEYDRNVIWGKGLKEAVYRVGTDSDNLLYTVEIGQWLYWFRWGAIFVAVVQVLQVLEEIVRGTAQVRKHLKPLNEIAAQAQALSEKTFDETKYHNLEDAISNFNAETIDAGIHMHDKDLMGIETALNGLLERIRESYKQQTQFVSDASHELRTPIAVIQGYVNMLDRWGKEDEAILDESIEAIKNEANHMQKLVEQLLFLARGDANRQSLDMKNLCLNDIMKEVYEESIMIDEKHQYRYEMTGKVNVYGDSDMLKQSARILIDNAAKYTEEGEEILIRVGEWKDGSPFYSIQDNGIGMAPQEVRHVFDRFYRADAVRNSKTGGTGLGLSIAKWIIERHQGYCDIVSREGLGTRFSVILRSV